MAMERSANKNSGLKLWELSSVEVEVEIEVKFEVYGNGKIYK